MQLTKVDMAVVIESALRHARLTRGHKFVQTRARKKKEILEDELRLAIKAVASNDIWDKAFDEVKVHVADTLFPSLPKVDRDHIREDAGCHNNMGAFLGTVRWHIKKRESDGNHPCLQCESIARKLAMIK